GLTVRGESHFRDRRRPAEVPPWIHPRSREPRRPQVLDHVSRGRLDTPCRGQCHAPASTTSGDRVADGCRDLLTARGLSRLKLTLPPPSVEECNKLSPTRRQAAWRVDLEARVAGLPSCRPPGA